jgi:transcriptional regulator with XRE-family HTH domain
MADPYVIDIGDRIRRARIAADVTQADLAKAVGLSRPSIANAETGNQNLTVTTLRSIAVRLGVTVAALIGEQELKLPPRVRVSASGWVVRCDECGLLEAMTTKSRMPAQRGRRGRPMADEERTGTCMAGSPDSNGRGGCKAYDPTTKRPYPQWPLCDWCLEASERDVRALTLDYRDLEQHLPPSLGVWGDGQPHGNDQPLPLSGHVLDLQLDIHWLTVAWADVVRDRDRLSDAPSRVRDGFAVQAAVTVLAPRVRLLAELEAVTMWCYPGTDQGSSDIAGWQGVLDLSKLHQRARSTLGLTREEPALMVGVLCRGCDLRSKLTRQAGADDVVCGVCGEHYTATEYADWVALLAAQERMTA